MSIQYTTEGVLMLPGGVGGETAKIRWINGSNLIKIHQGGHTIDLTVTQFTTIQENAAAIIDAARKNSNG